MHTVMIADRRPDALSGATTMERTVTAHEAGTVAGTVRRGGRPIARGAVIREIRNASHEGEEPT